MKVAAEPDNPGVKAMGDEQPSEFAHKPSAPGNSSAGGPTVAEEEEHKRGGKGAELREHNDCLQGMVLQDLYIEGLRQWDFGVQDSFLTVREASRHFPNSLITFSPK